MYKKGLLLEMCGKYPARNYQTVKKLLTSRDCTAENRSSSPSEFEPKLGSSLKFGALFRDDMAVGMSIWRHGEAQLTEFLLGRHSHILFPTSTIANNGELEWSRGLLLAVAPFFLSDWHKVRILMGARLFRHVRISLSRRLFLVEAFVGGDPFRRRTIKRLNQEPDVTISVVMHSEKDYFFFWDISLRLQNYR